MSSDKFTAQPYQEKVVKPWGYELILSPSDSAITSKIIHLRARARFSLQYHDEKEEVLTLLNGECLLHLEDSTGTMQQIKMEQKKGYLIRPMQKHRCQAVTDCEIFESSTRETGNTVRIEDDYNRGTETAEARKLRSKSDVYMG